MKASLRLMRSSRSISYWDLGATGMFDGIFAGELRTILSDLVFVFSLGLFASSRGGKWFMYKRRGVVKRLKPTGVAGSLSSLLY